MTAVVDAVHLIRRRSTELTDRFETAADLGQLEWCAAVLQEKGFLRDLLVALVRPMPAAGRVELRTALYGAVGAVHADDLEAAQAALQAALDLIRESR